MLNAIILSVMEPLKCGV